MFQVKNFSFSYPSNNDKSLDNISLSFIEGDVILLAGPNGSGKTTLLKSLMGIIPSMTGGAIEGEIAYCKKTITSYAVSELAGEVGFVLQDPENQITNLTVWEETTFGPSNLKWSKEKIIQGASIALKKVGLQNKDKESVLSLSAGQLQRLSLAGLISMQPSVLILDEPISNLDPHGIASIVRALSVIKKTAKLIIISTHLIEPFINLANRVVVIDEGKIALDGNINNLYKHTDFLLKHKIEIPQRYIVSEKLKKAGVKNFNPIGTKRVSDIKIKITLNEESKSKESLPLLNISNVTFSYEKGKPILEDVSFKINKFEQIVLAGKNGEGKTTLARLISGLLKPDLGIVFSPKIKTALLMQKPTLGFIGDTVLEEITYGKSTSKSEGIQWLERFNLEHLENISPFRISNGEQKRLALATAFSQSPDLLILDEPTTGLDSFQVKQLIKNIETFKGTVLYISHDIRMIENCSRLIVLGEKTIKYDGYRNHITPSLANYLGFPLVNLSTKLALSLKSKKIPLSPEEIEIYK